MKNETKNLAAEERKAIIERGAEENGRVELYTVNPGGALVSLHAIYCDCERCVEARKKGRA